MKITKKSQEYTQKPQQTLSKPVLSKLQRELFNENLESELPHGKWKGKSLGWVKTNENGYYQWMSKEGLIESWGLITLKSTAMVVEMDSIRPIWVGEYKWLGLRETSEPCTPSIWL